MKRRRGTSGYKRQLKSSRIHKKSVPLNICELPTEILAKIIGYLDINHHKSVRSTSWRLRDISDLIIVHIFRKIFWNHTTCNCKTHAVFKTIKYSTEVYLRSGFDRIFSSCFLPILFHNPNTSVCDEKLAKCLLRFFDAIERQFDSFTMQKCQLLHSMAMMNIFKAFKKVSISLSEFNFHKWQVIVDLKGPWLGALWKRSSDRQTSHRNLFNMLSSMLFFNIAGQSFRRVWESSNEVYVYGNDGAERKRVTRTTFAFTIRASREICLLFRSCLESDLKNIKWPTTLPKQQFYIDLEIKGAGMNSWGYSRSQHIHLGSSRNGDDYDEDEDMEGEGFFF
uniref:F-box domain-containing protein n=1 Tax=Glossina pallidipes TaxID=7398 RepID=A0A1A9Z5X6_GLOPL